MLKVRGGRCSFDPQELFVTAGGVGILCRLFQAQQNRCRGIDMITQQQGALVTYFAGNKGLCETKRLRRVGRQGELADSRVNVRERMSPGYPVEPAARGKVSDRNVLFAKLLKRLSRYLHVSEQADVVDIGDTNFLEQILLVADL